MNSHPTYDELQRQKAETQVLLGRIVMLWGEIMGIVYGLPTDLEFSSPDAIQLCLAELNGDGIRIDHLIKLLKHEPPFADVDNGRIKTAIAALQKLRKLALKRDAFIHGIPTLSLKRDRHTKMVIREGCYLIQTRKLDEKDRYLKVPEAAISFVMELVEAHREIQRVAKPMLFEDWAKLFRQFTPKQNLL